MRNSGNAIAAAAFIAFMGWMIYTVGDDHPMIKGGLALIEVRQR